MAFRREFAGKLWVEVMLLDGLNDSPEALSELAAVLKPIHPEQVQINLPTRPPAETWVQPASRQSLLLAKEILGEVARIIPPPGGYFSLGNPADIQEADPERHHPPPHAGGGAAGSAGECRPGRGAKSARFAGDQRAGQGGDALWYPLLERSQHAPSNLSLEKKVRSKWKIDCPSLNKSWQASPQTHLYARSCGGALDGGVQPRLWNGFHHHRREAPRRGERAAGGQSAHPIGMPAGRISPLGYPAGSQHRGGSHQLVAGGRSQPGS